MSLIFEMYFATTLFDSASHLASQLWPIFAVSGIVLGFLYNRFKNWMKNFINESMEPIRAEFKNNGGASLKDAVDKTNKTLAETKTELARTNEVIYHQREVMQDAVDRLDKKADASREAFEYESKKRLGAINRLTGAVNRVAADVKTVNTRVTALAANTDAAFYEIDAEAKLTYVNDAYLTLFNISYTEAMNNVWKEYIVEEDLSRLVRSAESAAKNQTDWVCEFSVLPKDKTTPVLVTARAFPIWDGDTFVGYAGAMTF